jgi:DnaJ-class molecular chaperone
MSLSGKPGERSDLYATIDVELPKQLTPEERTLFEELAKLERKKHSAA